MLDPREIAQIAIRGKAIQRRMVVERFFGGQAKLARELGITRSTVCHVVALRRKSNPIENYVAARVRNLDATWLGLWIPEWRKNGKKAA
jgi:hypothetical protein